MIKTLSIIAGLFVLIFLLYTTISLISYMPLKVLVWASLIYLLIVYMLAKFDEATKHK